MSKGFRLSEPLDEEMPQVDKPSPLFMVWSRVFCRNLGKESAIEFVRSLDDETVSKSIDDFISRMKSCGSESISSWFDDIHFPALLSKVSTPMIERMRSIGALQDETLEGFSYRYGLDVF